MRYLLLFLSVYFMSDLVAQNESVEQSQDVYFTQYNAEKNDLSVYDIEIDNNNRIIVATDKMLFSITSVGDLPKIILNNTYVSSAAFDDASNVYAAGNNIIYNIKDDKKIMLPDEDLVIADLEVIENEIWAATDNGVYVYDLSSKGWSEYNTRNSKLKSNVIYFIQKDKHGIIWIGTDNGYIRVKDTKWEHEEKGKSIYASRSNDEGQWMVSDSDMWLIDPFNRKFNVGLEDNLHKGKVNDFVIDSKGRIYMASDILVRYDPYKEIIEQYGEKAGVLSEKCLSLSVDQSDNIWLGTADAGMFRMTFGQVGPESLVTTILLENKLRCNNSNNGSFIISTSGGVEPYSFLWDDGSTESEKRSGLAAGVYNLKVTDAEGETSEASIELTEPTPIEIDVVEVKNISEAGKKDGAARVEANGGTGKLSYHWSNGVTGKYLKNVDQGSYIITVKDKNNCIAKKQVSIGDAMNIPDLAASEVEVGKILTINNLNFQADSSNVMTENYVILDEIYDFLEENPTVVIEIGGHTNTIPPHEYCDRLSTARARSVAEYIWNKGIDKNRVTYKGYGKRKPLVDSRSLKARRKNQRVEVKILEI